MLKQLSKTVVTAVGLVTSLSIGLSSLMPEEGRVELPPVTVENYKTVEDVAGSLNDTVFTIMGSQANATWGLDLIDGTKDGSYNYTSQGSGVRIYIVDTGVDALHPEFSGRVADGFDAFGQNLDQTDCNGHGTHVAGIAAGDYFGVAKSATIVPVRVMDCDGRGNTTTLTSGIDWIVSNYSGGAGVVNMSIGGNKDEKVNAAVSKLISAGLVVVAAAGNSGSDACNYSPASAAGVIATGAIDIFETVADFSNWGDCVDVLAPGVRINSANSSDYSMSRRMSGTSQASPFVAGAIATYLSSGSVTSPSQAEPYLRELAVNGIARVESEPAPLPEPTPEPTVEPEPELVEPEPSEPPAIDEPIVSEPEIVEDPINNLIKAEPRRIGSAFVNISWEQIDGVASYDIYRSPAVPEFVWEPVGSTTAEYSMRVVTSKKGSHYYFKVEAKMIDGSVIELGTTSYSSN